MESADLRKMLEEQDAGFRAIGAQPGAWLLTSIVLAKGIECTPAPLPAQRHRGAPKACFDNSQRVVIRSRRPLRYCEGFVLCDRLPIPIHHAWAIDKDLRVIDVTLEAPETFVYLGVPISRHKVIGLRERNKGGSYFMDPAEILLPEVFYELMPELRADVERCRASPR